MTSTYNPSEKFVSYDESSEMSLSCFVCATLINE